MKPKLGEILNKFMIGTSSNLSSKENIAVTAFMEKEIIRMAAEKGFKGIFTTTTNQLTHELTSNFLDYQTLREIILSEYADKDDSRPFSTLPNGLKIIVMYKELE